MIDFAKLKECMTIEEVAIGFLQLKVTEEGDSLRAKCPRCEGADNRSLIITPSKGLFYCFKARKGGDSLSLVSHCHDISVKDAAVALSKVYMDGESSESDKPHTEKENCFQPLEYLDHDHALVSELGFKDIAKLVGIGYAPKGLMRTHVAIPVRDANGNLLGYVGVKGYVKVPKTWRVP